MSTANRLASEKSPYLLQHAHNPVDWYPWGEEAFERARREGKPIFLSIGYSTCHWCHVMERESFEDEKVAELLNERYVSIKVDREERPDVDRVYMAAVQAMTGSGGWPLSAWLTPELEPFYTGTYFPPQPAHGRPSFVQVLTALADAWQNQREKVLTSASQLVEVLRGMDAPTDEAAADGQPARRLTDDQLEKVLDLGLEQLRRSHDPVHGGFGDAPKFPRPSVFDFLQRCSACRERAGDELATLTLRKMWAGGINDHLGGGYHRYSVDRLWRVSHFEKMLYDQAQMVGALLDAWSRERDPFFERAAREVLTYVARDLRHPEGGFYSAEDADSAPDPRHPERKLEGAFYLWTEAEIDRRLPEDQAAVVRLVYGIEPEGNTLNDPHGDFGAGNVLYRARGEDEVADELGLDEGEVASLLATARATLFQVRERRPRPHLDDKIVTSWNGLMIGAFASAGARLDDPELVATGAEAARFVLRHNVDGIDRDGPLEVLRRHRDGESAHPGQLDDHAFLAHGLLALWEATWDDAWLETALRLVETLLERFDGDGGALYDGPAGDPSILVRTRDGYDGAEPSGNSLAAICLLRLGGLLDRPEWERRARAIVDHFAPLLGRQPQAAPKSLELIDRLLRPQTRVAIAGELEAEDTKALIEAVRSAPFDPSRSLLVLHAGSRVAREQAPFWASLEPREGRATAWLCRGFACELPITDPQELSERLR
ncbi:MAG TPA: thioredoxin domain-containing protein [Thermoanaerobaculia bacterium]|nr:thioredoxin domain-containing protein [Thermoanaerobaculia bacterium]